MGGCADDDLFAVGYLAGEVQGGEVYASEWAAGEGKYVGHAGAGRGADEAGAAYLSCDVDHHLRWVGGGSVAGRLGRAWGLTGGGWLVGGGLVDGWLGWAGVGCWANYCGACGCGGWAGVGEGFGTGFEEGPGGPGQAEDEEYGQDGDVAWGEGPASVA